jgi:hypothetical protein
MTEITSLTTQPDPSEIAQNISGAFDQAYTALQAAWESMQAGRGEDAQGALVVVDQQLQVMADQISLQAALIVGQNEVISVLEEQRDDARNQVEMIAESVEQAKQDAYEEGYQEGANEDPDPYWLEEVIEEEVFERQHQIVESADYAADKLRTVGEADLAAEIEEKVKQALSLRDEAERLIERGHSVAWQKRQNQLPMVLDTSEEDESDE